MTKGSPYRAGLIESAPFNIVLAALYGTFTLVYLVTSQPPFDVTGHAIGRDFINLWTVGRYLSAGGYIPDVFDHLTYRPLQEALFGADLPSHNWSYPPHFLLIAVPLGWFPYLPSLVLWSLVTVGAYLLIVPRRRHLALLLAPATFANLFFGQTGCLIAALLIGGLGHLDKRPILAGVLLGLASIKPHLGIIVPVALIAAGAWRSIASATLTLLALFVLSGHLFGWEAWHAWFTTTTSFQTRILEQGTGLFTLMMPSAFMGARLIGLEIGHAYLVQAPFALIAAGATWWAFRLYGTVPMAIAVLLFSTVIVTPYIHIYDLTVVSPAVLLLLCHGRNEGFRFSEPYIWLVVWLLPIMVIALNWIGLPVGCLILTAALGFAVARLYDHAQKV